MTEVEFIVKIDKSKIALLKALTEAEEGLFFMRVDEHDKTVRLITTGALEQVAAEFLKNLSKFIEYEIKGIKCY